MKIKNKLTDHFTKQIKQLTIIKLILHTADWLKQPDHLLIITVIYGLSILSGALLPMYLVKISPGYSKVPETNSGITTHLLAVGISVYLIINWLESHQKHNQNISLEKHTFIVLIQTLIITVPLIAVDIANNITTEPIINNQYQEGTKTKNEQDPDHDTITTKDGHTYQIDDDHYVEYDYGNQKEAVIKLLYNQPLEIIYPKED